MIWPTFDEYERLCRSDRILKVWKMSRREAGGVDILVNWAGDDHPTKGLTWIIQWEDGATFVASLPNILLMITAQASAQCENTAKQTKAKKKSQTGNIWRHYLAARWRKIAITWHVSELGNFHQALWLDHQESFRNQNGKNEVAVWFCTSKQPCDYHRISPYFMLAAVTYP